MWTGVHVWDMISDMSQTILFFLYFLRKNNMIILKPVFICKSRPKRHNVTHVTRSNYWIIYNQLHKGYINILSDIQSLMTGSHYVYWVFLGGFCGSQLKHMYMVPDLPQGHTWLWITLYTWDNISYFTHRRVMYLIIAFVPSYHIPRMFPKLI